MDASPSPSAQSADLPAPARKWTDKTAPLAVAVLAATIATLAYLQFLDARSCLWTSGSHDRNAHYDSGLKVALHLRHGDLAGWLHDVHTARVWGPLHAQLVGVVLAVAGVDYHLAVLPSLLAWVLTAVLAFLTARRLARQGGNLAGCAAALLVLASPAHRAFATDIMLESLGAALTLAVLYLWLVAVQQPSPRAGRGLGLLLTALFLTKSNYWLIVALGLGIETAVRCWPMLRAKLSVLWAHLHWRRWVLAQLRQPLTYLLVPALALTAIVLIGTRQGPMVVHLGGRRVEVQSVQNLAYVAYLLLWLRLLPWWRRVGHPWAMRLKSPAREVIAWHGYAVALWFLWPQKLGNFLWYITRDHGQDSAHHAVTGGLRYYGSCIAQDYHVSLAGALLAAVLAGVAVLAWRRLRPGALGVFGVLIVAALLTNYQPAHHSRFLHSWIAIGWVAAGAGLALIAFSTVGSLGVWPRRRLGAGVLAALFVFEGPGLRHRGHAPEGGPSLDRPTIQELADCFLPELADCRHVTLVSNAPIRFFLDWSLAERFRNAGMAETNPAWALDPDNAEAFARWLRSTRSDAVVYVGMTAATPFDRPEPPQQADALPARFAAQADFVPVRRWDFPQYGGCNVLLWRRTASAP